MSRRILTRTLLLTAGIATLPGCGGLRSVDRAVDDLIILRARELGPSSATPQTQFSDPADDASKPSSAKIPQTENPDAERLRFDPADANDDLSARLDRYASIANAPDATPLDLEGALSRALVGSRALRNAEEQYVLSAISVLLARREFTPRLFNNTDVNIAGDGANGRIDSALTVLNELGVTRNLRSGGRVAASWVAELTEDLRTAASDRTSTASSLVLSGEIPLLRGFGRVARENEIQAERNLVYAARTFERFRRTLLVDVASDYFNLLLAQAAIANQERQLESFRALEAQTAARVEAGRLEEFQRALAANQVLSASAVLASLRESYILQLDRFKLRLDIPIEEPVRILPVDFDIPAPRISVADATRAALDYRLDLQTTRDQIEDAQREIDVARNQLKANLDLTGRVELPTDTSDRQGTANFDPEDLNYSAGFRFSLPLDRDDERLRLRQSQIELEQSRRSYTLARDNVVIDARSSVRSIDLARFQLELAERQVGLNERRVLAQELNIDEIEPQELVDTQNELLEAENDRDQALTNLRTAILDYLLATGQMRVDAEGRFEPLTGLEITRSPQDTTEDEPAEEEPAEEEPVESKPAQDSAENSGELGNSDSDS